MLNIGPWNRLGLTIQWLKQEYAHEFSGFFKPPLHMPIVYGLVEDSSDECNTMLDFSGCCSICNKPFLVSNILNDFARFYH